jgi:NHLM bacteriocin system ABC transporter ATP-binding protein
MSATHPIADAIEIEMRANQALRIDDPARVWIVETGSLDLFLQTVDERGEPAGPRQHVLRAGPGQPLFGMPVAAARSNLVLLAVGVPGTRVRRIPLAVLREPAPDGNLTPTALVLVQSWIDLLSRVAAPDVPPKIFFPLVPGKVVKVPPTRPSVCAGRDVVWVRHKAGSSYYLGMEAAVVNGGCALPMSTHAWLVAAEQTALDCQDSIAHFREDPEWHGLDAFHRAILPVLMAGHLEADRRETDRLVAKAGMDRRRMSAALTRLVSVLSPGVHNAVTLVESEGSPLFQAARIVGASTGIDIRPPVQTPRLASKDPLRDIARASGIRTRQVLLRGPWWRDDHGPMLGYLTEGKRPVALVPRNGGYDLHDGETGTVRRINRELGFALEPFAFVFYRPLPGTKITGRDLVHFGLSNCRPELRLVLLTGIAGGLLNLAIPIFTGMVFDTIIPSAQRGQLVQITMLLMAGALAAGMFDVTRSLALLRLDGRMGATLQAAIWDRLLSLPVPFFRRYSAGDLADRANGIDVIRQGLTGTVTNSIVSGIFSVFNLGLMLYYSWKLAVVAMGLVLIALIVMAVVGYAQLRHSRELSQTAGKLSGQVLEFITGVAKFRASGSEARAFAAWTRGYSRQKQLLWSTRTISNSFSVFNSVFFVLAPMSIFFAVYYWTGRIGAGDFMAFNSAFGQLFNASLAMAGAILQVYSFVPLFERAKPILLTAPEIDSAKADPGELAGSVEVSHLAFRYSEDGPLILKDVSLKIEAGEFVAIVGPSGCGKSTLFRMLLGFERPEGGSVFYDGQDLKGLDLNSVRRQIGVVLQNSTLFRGDIFANIVGSKPLTLDDAWEAARLAGLDKDLRQMPMGMHTVVSDGGGGLSGGQRQRLMIARAIVSRPRVLFFDEATSALDNNTQAVVSRSLEGLKATRIVIAHRLSTVQNADRIYVFDEGSVVQSGTFAELIEQEGLFATLARRQLT